MYDSYSISDKAICLIVSFMIASCYLFEMETWGRYVIFALSVLVFLIYAFQNEMKVSLHLESFHFHVIAFALFSFCSAMWAWNSSLAIGKGITIFFILVSLSLIYPYYSDLGSIEPLLKSIMIAGYIVCIYVVVYYGVSGFSTLLIDNTRIGNDFTNANSLGLVAAVSCLIQLFFLLQKKRSFLIFFIAPAILVLAISQSRKAIIMLVLGVFLIVATNGSKGLGKRILSFFIAAAILVLMIYIISKVEIFSGVLSRFETLFESMNGQRTEDIRSIYRRIGMEQFYKTPLFGIGIGNTLELLNETYGVRTYLHCNFVEMLASGGIVGFAIYYSMYAAVGITLWKNRDEDSKITMICLVIEMLLLIMDYGMVTYYIKQQYIYLMCFFLQCKFCKQRNDSTELTDEIYEG